MKKVLSAALILFGLVFFTLALSRYLTDGEEWPVWSFLSAAFFSGGMVLRLKQGQEGDVPKSPQPRKELDARRKEELDRVIEYVKEKGTFLSYHIEEINRSLSLTDSKFGGYPYWPAEKEYPTDSHGEKIFLLAQINFEQMVPEDDLLPKNGILQFFIANDDLCGANFDDLTDQKDFRVIYHPETGDGLDVEQLRALGIKANTDLTFGESMLPSVCEDAIIFTKSVDSISEAFDEFEDYAKEALSVLCGQTVEGTLYRGLERAEYEYLTEPFCAFGHKMLGIPAFTQQDPRYHEAEIPEHKKGTAKTVEHYDTLLLQMDSRGNLQWGDDGVANFFINSEDLKNRNFSDVLYNWDCY